MSVVYKKPFPSRAADKFVVRLPDGMRTSIAKLARDNNRSMNSEILDRLEKSFIEDNSRNKPVQGQWTPVIGMLVTTPDGVGSIVSFLIEMEGKTTKEINLKVGNTYYSSKVVKPFIVTP